MNPATGLLTWTASTAGTQTVTADASGPTGLTTSQSFNIVVQPADPSLTAVATGGAIAGTQTYVSLNASQPAASWQVNWGDGSTPDTVTGAAVQDGHVYAAPGNYAVTAVASYASGNQFAAPIAPISVAPNTFEVTGVLAETSGFHAEFNGVLDPASVSSQPGTNGAAPSVVLIGLMTGVVEGTVVIDPNGAGLTFVATSGALAAGTYEVAIRGIVEDERGRTLDGNGDGMAGDDLLTTVTIPAGIDSLALPPVMRGPGQTIQVPLAGAGLPVAFTSDGTAYAVTFTVAYNPALLSITGASAAAGCPRAPP